MLDREEESFPLRNREPLKVLIFLMNNTNSTVNCILQFFVVLPTSHAGFYHISKSKDSAIYCLNTFRQAIATKFSNYQWK